MIDRPWLPGVYSPQTRETSGIKYRQRYKVYLKNWKDSKWEVLGKVMQIVRFACGFEE